MKETAMFEPVQRCKITTSLFGLLMVGVLTVLGTPLSHAQTFSVIHSFAGGEDGYQPYAGVTVDQGGNLYGTTTEFTGNPPGPGTVFQMKNRNGAWILKTLSTFSLIGGGPFIPWGRPVIGPGGALYGTTFYGGQGFCTELGCGSVYLLQPQQTVCAAFNCPWTVSSEYSFTGPDGFEPAFVDPAFDSAGNLYGSTTEGGANGDGNVFKLTRSNGQWTATSLHDFNGSDGKYPQSGVVPDAQGNVYGTAWMGGPNGNGAVYRLTRSGSSYVEETLHSFQNGSDGQYPVGGLVFDQAGNLYGTTYLGGSNGGGTAFELSPSGGGWDFSVLYSFTGQGNDLGPFDTLTLDAAGNLYGTTYSEGAFGDGTVFKLTRNNGSWTYTDLHDFTNGDDGGNPTGGVALDAHGNLYGTTSGGGSPGHCNGACGVVWEITP
jgi:uncharacterized repeat protein (TIGR03803 family)